jgi:integrase
MSRRRKLPDGMVTRPGRRGYYADFRVGGTRVQRKLSTDFDAARSILLDLKARADKAKFNLLDNNHALASLKTAYLQHCRQALKPRTVDTYVKQLDNILGAEKRAVAKIDPLPCATVSQLTTSAILTYRKDRLSQGRSPRTINAEVQALGGMLNWAVDHRLISSNPIRSVKPLPHDHPKEGRPLSPEEVARLLKASPSLWRDVWYTLLVTGMRESELVNLQFVDLDFHSREILIRADATKNHAERRIPMDDQLYQLLRRLEGERNARMPGHGRNQRDTARTKERFSRNHVFVSGQNTPLDDGGNFYKAFKRCCRKARIPMRTYDSEGRVFEHVDVHSLRRTFATEAISSGADPKSIQELLGHKTLAMTMKIYTKIRTQTKRQAIARLPYGAGATTPNHLVELPTARTNPVLFGDAAPATKEMAAQAASGQ